MKQNPIKTAHLSIEEKRELERITDMVLSMDYVSEYKFPRSKVIKAITNVYINGDCPILNDIEENHNQLCMPVFLCSNNNEIEKKICDGIISLVTKHKSYSIVTIGKKTNKVALIFGAVAAELCNTSTVDWNNLIVKSNKTTIPITMDITAKLHTLKNATIANEMKRLEKNVKTTNTKTLKKKATKKVIKKLTKKTNVKHTKKSTKKGSN